ncbi:1-phosphatidylinositol phosphodiesterase [Staphylococcus lutrae]|uniref:1-phosphatidylinositol phosphodiesterase n=2 Tax=Staphylococcus lutrae TaxID=155085 RepID=A0AAC9RUU3_9STAP|nr:phosphatidylinositol-specific phospholipase C [Staphylococcus lutrae]ARJ51986.1 1-phosphatidylinositol phosphodiesterase [Staphylococcus lutrae]PNZ37877.1 1-phosphatidylinositol phosphodiesterase [Staphylococcus lutrae]
MMKRIGAFALVVSLMLLFTPIARASVVLSEHSENWMSSLDAHLPLTEINIPGTHDSGSFTLEDPVKSVWAKTQTLNYIQQMEHGIRFFDIRGRASTNQTISIHHGVIYLHHELGTFLNAARAYLTVYPHETIIMSMKKDHYNDSHVHQSFESVFREHYFDDPRFSTLFYKGHHSNPTLAETRGKIVLFNRMGPTQMTSGYGTSRQGIHWSDNATFATEINEKHIHLVVQDEYKDYYGDKLAAVKNLLMRSKTNSDPHTLYMNYLNVSSGGSALNSIYYYASYINPNIAKTIKDMGKSRTGWVIVDYSGYRWAGFDDIVDDVIDSNSIPSLHV